MVDKQHIRAVIEAAFVNAGAATNAVLAEGGSWYPCGFAWVTVAPGTSAVAKVLKDYGGRKAYGEPGIQVWNPSGSPTQQMDAKEAGARAFADTLRAAFPDLKVRVGSRMD